LGIAEEAGGEGARLPVEGAAAEAEEAEELRTTGGRRPWEAEELVYNLQAIVDWQLTPPLRSMNIERFYTTEHRKKTKKSRDFTAPKSPVSQENLSLGPWRKPVQMAKGPTGSCWVGEEAECQGGDLEPSPVSQEKMPLGPWRQPVQMVKGQLVTIGRTRGRLGRGRSERPEWGARSRRPRGVRSPRVPPPRQFDGSATRALLPPNESVADAFLRWLRVPDGGSSNKEILEDGDGSKTTHGQSGYLQEGPWDAIHVIEVKLEEDGIAYYSLTSTAMLSITTECKSSAIFNLSGSIRR
ncbi:hypothetical protein Taro_046017, partial [Colocasia esculenta]|nr:hypothetical protein [Colocasia esculenta]